MLHKIKACIDSSKIEEAYNLIIQNEYIYINNDFYWILRGELCQLIGEYETASSCYTKAKLINPYNKESVKKLINVSIKLNKFNDVKSFEIEIGNMEKLIYNKLIENIQSNFNGLDNSGILNLVEGMDDTTFYCNKDFLHGKSEIIKLDAITDSISKRAHVIIPFTYTYVEIVKSLAKVNIESCRIMLQDGEEIRYVEIDKEILESIKTDEYKRTITINKLSASDSNVNALLKYIPEMYKDKYKLNIINGYDVLSLENKITVPLKSPMTIGGFSMFLNYPMPNLTYNLEVGHASMIFKSIGNMAKKNKNFAFTQNEYQNVNKVCVTSNMDMIFQASATALQEDKFLISGMPRTDTLLKTDGRRNLEKVLKIKLDNKKIIFNMPTFHKHDNSGVIQGDISLNNYVKINDFDYVEFDKYLEKNNMICVMKVHHAEAKSVSINKVKMKLKNIYFIDNSNLEKENMDLYEIINAGDILITDYSSIYSDFLFMNKPVVFTNSDIEKYREDVGLLLEPYDFWTAGPKVKNQQDLQNELLKSMDENYYRSEREKLRPVFFNSLEGGATERVWDFINGVFENEIK
ncbi:MAG: CDP-glycerol glycerophosphotransferase family protein [Clostridium sp.]